MDLNNCKQFYLDNPFAALFVIADLLGNLACVWMFSDFNSWQGWMFSISGLAIAAAIALALPLVGSFAPISKVVLVCWIGFTIASFSLSFVTSWGRMEYAKYSADKSTLLHQSLSADINTLNDAGYREWCKTAKSADCNQLQLTQQSKAARAELDDHNFKWSPHQMEFQGFKFGQYIVIGLVFLLSLGGAIGSSIMGYIAGLRTNAASAKGSRDEGKKPELRGVG